MKTVKVIVEFEVEDDFEDVDGLVEFVNGTMDNADSDFQPEGSDQGIIYLGGVEKE